MTLKIDSHPLLHLGVFTSSLPQPLGRLQTPETILELLSPDAETPFERSEPLRVAIRDLLRHGGFKPTGRGKPASEYLVRAAKEEKLKPINAVVDACNVVSLHSGLPISVVDLDLAVPPFRVAIADESSSYVFNASGQEIDVSGLLCFHDEEGPCANAVKDAQRTKTHDGTLRVLCLVWGCCDFSSETDSATDWYRQLLTAAGATCADVCRTS